MPLSTKSQRIVDLNMVDEALDALFEPQSIAILGASGRTENPFARPLKYLVDYGYEGAIYPINPGYDSLHGVPCYPDVSHVPGNIDLALALIPADGIEAQIPALAAAGTRAVVVFASGFAETGEDGRQKQESLTETSRRHGIRLIGPNCQGVLSLANNTFGTFTPALEDGVLRKGGLSYVGQSGAVGGSILSLARERGIGIASWVSTGNEADLNSMEIGRYLLEKEATTVLALYLESAVDEMAFQSLARRAQELGKSIILLRSATSPVGAKAAASHTGAILGDNAAFDVVVKENGVVQVEDVDELVRMAHAHTVLPKSYGPKLAIVSTSGGAGSLAADAAYDFGLEVVELADSDQEKLKLLVPDYGATANPIDVTAQIFKSGNAAEFLSVCKVALDLDEIDATMIVLTLVTGDLAVSIAESLANAQFSKPVALVWLAATNQTAAAREILRDHGFPVFDSTRQAAAALRSLINFPQQHIPNNRPSDYQVDKVKDILREQQSSTIGEGTAAQLFDAIGVSHPKSWLLRNVDEAHDLAAQLQDPVVVKIQAPEILHKTERGGVVVGVQPGDVARTVQHMFELFASDNPDGVLVSELVPPGVEIIFGVTRAAISGAPMVTVGLGGTATEIYRDTITTFAPVTPQHATQMLTKLRAAQLLTGFRGSEAVNMQALADAIHRLSWLAVDAGDALREFEINPLRALPSGTVALDFLMIRTQEEHS